jgi:hypothetical protein
LKAIAAKLRRNGCLTIWVDAYAAQRYAYA